MRFICALLVLCTVCSAAMGSSLSDLRGLRTRGSRFPIYHKEHLQIMLYSAGTERNGNLISATDPVMDIIRRGADVDDVAAGGKAVPYRLNAPLAEIFAFWSRRLYSEGVIFSSKADIDQEKRLAGGAEKVSFRSPLVDLDGVGFDADYGKRTVLVKKDVNIVLRMNSSDPVTLARKGGKLPEKYEYLTAVCDSMFLDFTGKKIQLLGNVKVNEERALVTCDRMTIFLDRNKKKKSAVPSDDITGGVNGVSRILCEGNVVITRLGSDGKIPSDSAARQQALAEKVLYELDSGLLTMTGTQTVQPEIRQGNNRLTGDTIEIYRDKELMKAIRNCRINVTDTGKSDGKVTAMTADNISFDYRGNEGWFIGNVVVEDGPNTLSCPRMKVTLRSDGTAVKEKKSDSSFMPGFSSGPRRELDRIVCMDNVTILHNPPEQKTAAILTSKTCTYEFSTGAALFEEEVKIRDPRMHVDCDRMTVFTASDGGKTRTAPGRSAAGGRRLDRIECSGNVHARDAQGKLYSDDLKLYFAESSGKPELKMQMLNSGTRELVKVTCDGNVKLQNIPSTEQKTPDKEKKGALSGMFKRGSSQPMTLTADRGIADIRSNRSEFHGDVRLREEQTQLDCQSLYLLAAQAPRGVLKPLAVPSADEEIDRDPLAIQAESEIPSQLNIGEGRELKEVIAEKEVVIRRISDTGRQIATGDRAHYTVADRTIVLTGTDDEPPVLSDPAQGKMSGRYVIVDLAREQMYVKEDTRLDFKGLGRKKP